MNQQINISAILPSPERIAAMARRRYQHPRVEKTITKDKSAARWYFRARIDALIGPGETGRVEDRFYLGSVLQMTKREAEQARDAVLAEAINKPEVMLSSQVRFGQVLDKWLATADVREGTMDGYASIVNKHLRPQWGNARMCDITPLAVEAWLTTTARKHAKSTLDNIKFRFTQVWKRATFWRFTREVCPVFGMQKISNFGKPARAKTLPNREQFQNFLYLLDEPYRSIVIVCAFTGLRISEAMALTLAQLNSPSATITEAANRSGNIVPLKGKHSGRKVPIGHLHNDISIDWKAPSNNRPFNVGYIEIHHAIKEAGKLADIDYPGFGCHTFRRMHNTMFRRLAERGADGVKLSMAQLGHGDESTNDLYFVQDDSDIKKRAEIAGEVYDNVMRETVN
jgi:integrase